MNDKLDRIINTVKILEASETCSLDDPKIDNSYCVGISKRAKGGKRFACFKCKADVWLTGNNRKLIEQKRGKPVCIKCAFLIMEKSGKPMLAMFEADKEKTRKLIDRELDNLVPYDGG